MTKVVINSCYGGFGLSNKAFEMLLHVKGIEYEKVPAKHAFNGKECDYYRRGHLGESEHYLWYYQFADDRSDADLINVVETLGEEANSRCADLKIIEIPDDVEWQIEEYDGNEWVAEKHRTWR